jgi:hypothetical protein
MVKGEGVGAANRGPPARPPRLVEHGDVVPVIRQRAGGHQTGQPGTDDGDGKRFAGLRW